MTRRNKLLMGLGGVALLGVGYAAGAADAPVPKAYIIAEINVTDPATYKSYSDQVPAIVAKYGGRYLVRGGNPVALEGAPPAPRAAVIEFPSKAAAQAYYHSEYQKIIPIRQSASTGRLFLAEGTAP